MKSSGRVAIAAAVLCLSLTGCMPRATPVVATPDYETSVRTITTPPPDRARVYIVSGKTPSGSLFGSPYRVHGISGDIYADGVKIGSLNPGEVMVVDMVPGKHVFYWHYLNQSGGPLLKSDRLERDLPGGALLVMSTDIGMFNLMMNPSTMSTEEFVARGNTIPPDMKVVRPGSCPPTICL